MIFYQFIIVKLYNTIKSIPVADFDIVQTIILMDSGIIDFY